MCYRFRMPALTGPLPVWAELLLMVGEPSRPPRASSPPSAIVPFQSGCSHAVRTSGPSMPRKYSPPARGCAVRVAPCLSRVGVARRARPSRAAMAVCQYLLRSPVRWTELLLAGQRANAMWLSYEGAPRPPSPAFSSSTRGGARGPQVAAACRPRARHHPPDRDASAKLAHGGSAPAPRRRAARRGRPARVHTRCERDSRTRATSRR